MAITIDWGNTFIINVPKADLTLVSGTLYDLDTEVFRQALKDLEDDEAGIAFPDTHNRNAPVTVAGITYAQTLEVLSPYSVQFEDGTYTVRLIGSNNNIFDVENGILVQNTVSVIPTNSAGLIISVQGSGLSTPQDEALTEMLKITKNKVITDPTTGKLTVYDDDGTSVLLQGDLWEDAAGTVPYQGSGAERRDRLV